MFHLDLQPDGINRQEAQKGKIINFLHVVFSRISKGSLLLDGCYGCTRTRGTKHFIILPKFIGIEVCRFLVPTVFKSTFSVPIRSNKSTSTPQSSHTQSVTANEYISLSNVNSSHSPFRISNPRTSTFHDTAQHVHGQHQ